MRFPLHCESIEVMGLPCSFALFVRHMLDTDERFNSSGVGIRAAVKIEAALGATKPGERMQLDEADWKLLAEVVEKPSGGYPIVSSEDGGRAHIARFLLPFIDAIATAPEKTPTEAHAAQDGG